MTKTLAGASPVDQPVRPREVPLPGGLRLTVTERCELYDWRDACVAEAETAARMAGVHSVQEQTAVIVRAALELLESIEGETPFTAEAARAFKRVFGA
jgi:hypothetical protein